jgi:hypothetical protein
MVSGAVVDPHGNAVAGAIISITSTVSGVHSDRDDEL